MSKEKKHRAVDPFTERELFGTSFDRRLPSTGFDLFQIAQIAISRNVPAIKLFLLSDLQLKQLASIEWEILHDIPPFGPQ